MDQVVSTSNEVPYAEVMEHPIDSRRRQLLAGLGAGLGLLSLGPISRGGATGQARREEGARGPDLEVRLDRRFARAWLDAYPHKPRPEELISSPALAALVRHARLSGDADASPESVLRRIYAAHYEPPGLRRVMDHWARKRALLLRHVGEALVYLPPGTRPPRTVFFVVGYDIGVASPPDVALNLGHPRLMQYPTELGYLLTHEAHHVGFLQHRPMPSLLGLEEPRRLLALIHGLTQMEGMAVHAARASRAEDGQLARDADYRVYREPAFAARALKRYQEIARAVARSPRLAPRDVGAVLEAMSTKERLWYRVGAIVCERIEAWEGREALVETITRPERFVAVLESLKVGTRA
jgi:hypothetical protein